MIPRVFGEAMGSFVVEKQNAAAATWQLTLPLAGKRRDIRSHMKHGFLAGLYLL